MKEVKEDEFPAYLENVLSEITGQIESLMEA
jgi:hypothetical protein